jgi:hypothetical protein
LFNLALGLAFVLDVTGTQPLERLGHGTVLWLLQLSWLSLPLALLGNVVFLLYVKGMAQANEVYEFIRDPVELIALGLIVYVLLLPLVWALARILDWILNGLRTGGYGPLGFLGLPRDMMLRGPAIFATFALMMWPFVGYCRMLIRLRETLLRRVEQETDPTRKHAWPT